MLRGFYTAASGILTQQRSLDVLANNIANVRTPGFRASRVVSGSFEQELQARMEGQNSALIGSSAPMQVVSEVPTRWFDTSFLQETGSPFDLAIDGEGFFNIQAPADADGGEGPRYLTRNGSFVRNGEGQLELEGVGLVLGQDGPITLEDAGFTVEADGSVYDSEGDYVDQLLVTLPPADVEIRLAGNGLYTAEALEDNPQVDGSTRLVQGWLESANVDLNREYAAVIEAQRAFQACSTALQIIDKIDQRAATEIAAL